jgi:hypothetical protein
MSVHAAVETAAALGAHLDDAVHNGARGADADAGHPVPGHRRRRQRRLRAGLPRARVSIDQLPPQSPRAVLSSRANQRQRVQCAHGGSEASVGELRGQ